MLDGQGRQVGVAHERSAGLSDDEQAALVAASPGLRLIRPTWKGATGSGQTMPASSWLASMIAPTSRETPIP